MLETTIVVLDFFQRLPEFEIQCGLDVDCREWIDAHLPKTVFVMPKQISNDAGSDRLMTASAVNVVWNLFDGNM